LFNSTAQLTHFVTRETAICMVGSLACGKHHAGYTVLLVQTDSQMLFNTTHTHVHNCKRKQNVALTDLWFHISLNFPAPLFPLLTEINGFKMITNCSLRHYGI
jgi:hypothetical protein